MMCTNPTIANRNIEQTIKLANGVAECESGGEAAVSGCQPPVDGMAECVQYVNF